MWDIDNGNSECLSDLPKDMYLYESRSMKKTHFYVWGISVKRKRDGIFKIRILLGNPE